jgi:hypothetical protein
VSPLAHNVHGAAGKPRPVITLNNNGSAGFTVVGRLAHVEIDTAARQLPIYIPGGAQVAEDIIVRSSLDGAKACYMIDGTLRDSVCLASGTGALAVSVYGSGIAAPLIRNVTAISSSASANAGISLDVSTGSTTSLSVKSTIARATAGKDIKATEAAGATASITVDHSNYVTTDDQMGAAPINDIGGKQTGAPSLAADGYHQLPGSTATIDQGATDGNSGNADIDGQFRSIELGCSPIGCAGDPHTDIGADELGRPAAVSLDCTPASLVLGSGGSSCHVLLADTGVASEYKYSPTGSVALASSGGGGFATNSCALEPVPVITPFSECTVAYTPSAVGTHSLTGIYTPDDRTHEPSEGSTQLVVTAPPAAATPASATTQPVKKCKKGRKLKRGRCVKKKKK